MKDFVVRLLRWFPPVSSSQSARCMACGCVESKAAMHRDKLYGWFCNEDEFVRYYYGEQW